MKNAPWRKAPEELVERFAAGVAGIDGLEQRKMFGYPAGFIGGNMTTGLHQESWIVRLPEEERRERLDAGRGDLRANAGPPDARVRRPPRRGARRSRPGTLLGRARGGPRSHSPAEGAEAAMSVDEPSRPMARLA